MTAGELYAALGALLESPHVNRDAEITAVTRRGTIMKVEGLSIAVYAQGALKIILK